MLHTVHMFCKVKTDFYYALSKTLHKLSKLNESKFYSRDNGSFYCELLKDHGINLILKRIEQVDGPSYSALEVIMNPMRLLDSNEYYQLTDTKHFEDINLEFQKVFKPIKKEFGRNKQNKYFKFKLDKLESYSLKRVDFAINIETEEIEQYMGLIVRANIPDGFHQYVEYDKSSKRRKPPKGSFYISEKNKDHKPTVTVNCYNKGEQLKERNLPCNEKANKTIRFEVQCHYNKTYSITRSEGFENYGFQYILCGEVSFKTLRFYYKKTIGLGDYYSLSKAKEIIQSKRMKKEKKDGLIKILDLVNEKRGIWKARMKMENKKDFDDKIKALHKHGVNPVTIPVKWGIEYLPCLFYSA
jgi:hypothetical protein